MEFVFTAGAIWDFYKLSTMIEGINCTTHKTIYIYIICFQTSLHKLLFHSIVFCHLICYFLTVTTRQYPSSDSVYKFVIFLCYICSFSVNFCGSINFSFTSAIVPYHTSCLYTPCVANCSLIRLLNSILVNTIK